MKLDMVKQSLPFLIICGIGEVFAGTILGFMKDLFISYPGLIIIMPAVIGMRGNIVTTLGSRLGSSIHLGVIDPENVISDPETKENIYATLILSAAMAIIISIIAYTSSKSAGVKTIDLFPLISVTLISSLISGLILISITIGIIVLSFAKGLDPDNVTAPILTTVGDIISIFTIYFVVESLHFLGVIG
jgi:mgtE-like transporter